MLLQKRDFLSHSIVVALVFISIASMSSIIDGITYPKVATGIICVTALVPVTLRALSSKFKMAALSKSLLVLLAVFILAYCLDKFKYRAVFGAPGRNNGIISLVVFFSFILLGMYLNAENRLIHLLIVLSCFTGVISFFILLKSVGGIENKLFLQFYQTNEFHANSNMVGSLLLLGTLSSACLLMREKSWSKKTLLMAMLLNFIALTSLNLLQSFLILSVGLFLTYTKIGEIDKYKRVIPVIAVSIYLISFKLLDSIKSISDLSIKERMEIIRLWPDTIKSNQIFTSRIDGLSDLTSTALPNQIVDDFHNLYLQISGTFGIVFGVCFFLFMSWPFFLKFTHHSESNWVFPIYTCFYLQLFIGIFDPIYCYWGGALMGGLLGNLLVSRKESSSPQNSPAFGFVIIPLLFLLPISVWQASDFYYRKSISGIFTSTGSVGFISEDKLKLLTTQILKVKDANYRVIYIANLRVANLCSLADAIRVETLKDNPLEVRLASSIRPSDECLR